jgi:hypothetical protein
MTAASPHPRLNDLPLWRLLVALDDAERTVGADSSTARALARAVRAKLRAEVPDPDTRPPREEAAHAE